MKSQDVTVSVMTLEQDIFDKNYCKLTERFNRLMKTYYQTLPLNNTFAIKALTSFLCQGLFYFINLFKFSKTDEITEIK